MKIVLRHFGPLRSFSFDTGNPLQVVTGANNAGKSYALYALYLTLKNLLAFQPETFLEHDFGLGFAETAPQTDVSPRIENALQQFLNQHLTPKLHQSLLNTFRSIENLQNQRAEEKAEIELQFSQLAMVFAVDADSQTLTTKSVRLVSPLLYLPDEDGTPLLAFQNLPDDTYFANFLPILLLETLWEEVREQASAIYFMPSSRSGLYQAFVAFLAIFSEMRNQPGFLRTRVELPGISEPVADYFRNLFNMTEKPDDHPSSLDAQQIERHILRGEIVFNPVNRHLAYIPSGSSLRLDLPVASSMVVELAPIVAHIKYVIARPDRLFEDETLRSAPILFIEEPETHLDEDMQDRLMRAFIDLAQHGLKIVLSTHSRAMLEAAKKNRSGFAVNLITLKPSPKGSVAE